MVRIVALAIRLVDSVRETRRLESKQPGVFIIVDRPLYTLASR